MMTKLIYIFLLGVALGDLNAEIKMTSRLSSLDKFKNSIIAPLMNDSIQNISIPLNIHLIQQEIPLIGLVDLSLNDLLIEKALLDWENTHVRPYHAQSNRMLVDLYKMNMKLKVHIHATIGNFTLMDTITEIQLTDLTVSLKMRLDDSMSEQSWGFIPVIEDSSVKVKKIHVNFQDETLETDIVNGMIELFQSLIPSLARKVINSEMSPMISEKASTTIMEFILPVPTTGQKYLLTLHTVGSPKIFYQDDIQYFGLSLDLQIKNIVSGKQCPQFNYGILPDRLLAVEDDTQLVVGDNILNQLLWILIDSQLIKYYISQSDIDVLPVNLPIALNTTSLKLIMPQLAKQYGDNKGVYLGIQMPDQDPQVFLRTGRIVGSITLRLDFIVDTDSSNYPNQKPPKCTTCVSGHVVDAKLEFMVTAFNRGVDILAGNIMQVQILDMKPVGGEVGIDDIYVQKTLNSLIDIFVPQINVKANAGIKNPSALIKGLETFELVLGDTFLTSSLVFGQKSKLINQNY